MKKIYATKSKTFIVPQHRTFRRQITKWFAAFLAQNHNGLNNKYRAVFLEKFQELGYSIEILARKMTGQPRRRK